MQEDYKNISEAVRNQKYFEDSRSWFQAVFIAPISERTIFLTIFLLAMLIATFSAIAVMNMMPLTNRALVMIPATEDVDRFSYSLTKLKNNGESLDVALKKAFVGQYVEARESYNPAFWTRYGLFVYANSAPEIYQAFQTITAPTNPESYAAKLGQEGMRTIDILNVSLSTQGKTDAAKVTYQVYVKGAEDNQKSKWTANLTYQYTGAVLKEVNNPETGSIELEVTDPTFQVTSYEVKQN